MVMSQQCHSDVTVVSHGKGHWNICLQHLPTWSAAASSRTSPQHPVGFGFRVGFGFSFGFGFHYEFSFQFGLGLVSMMGLVSMLGLGFHVWFGFHFGLVAVLSLVSS